MPKLFLERVNKLVGMRSIVHVLTSFFLFKNKPQFIKNCLHLKTVSWNELTSEKKKLSLKTDHLPSSGSPSHRQIPNKTS